MKTNTCKCGELKDHRSKLCRKCTNINRSNLPCKGCGRCKPKMIFGKLRNGTMGLKRKGLCDECEKKRSKEYRDRYLEKIKQRRKMYKEKYPDRIRRSYMRSNWLKMGLNPDFVEEYIKTHNVCEICGSSGNGKSLYVDHCHKTNKLRGVLCSNCNFGVGSFKDKPELLVRAAEYLNTFRAQAAV